MWKTVTEILNFCLTETIKFCDILHSFHTIIGIVTAYL